MQAVQTERPGRQTVISLSRMTAAVDTYTAK